MDTDLPASAVTAIGAADTTRWIDKAQRRIDPFRDAIAATGGRSRHVTARCVADVRQAEYGNFMLSWLVPEGEGVVLTHLPDAGFFLRLLQLAYQPILAGRPELQTCLVDGSRIELAFTNDVLQAQAAGPPGRYSMVRHHALVLYAATQWLAEPARTRWLRLEQECLTSWAGRSAGPPSADELADIQGSAFADFATYAEDSRDPVAAVALLADRARLQNAINYQVVATAAIGVVERQRRAEGGDASGHWLAEQLGAAAEDDYLLEQWRALR